MQTLRDSGAVFVPVKISLVFTMDTMEKFTKNNLNALNKVKEFFGHVCSCWWIISP
ncbi:hypothetical protein HHE02_01560 [Helicobacter heilmannii]|nr:hypothetical protein HHE02_01560 [Helicobacter heilmannii]